MKAKIIFQRFFRLSITLWLLSAMPLFGEVKIYPPYPGAIENPDYSVEVNGQPVFVYNHKDYRTADSRMGYAQFEMTSKVTIVITYNKGTVNTCQISPLAYGVTPVINGNKVTFELDQPRYLIAFFNKGNQANFLSDGLMLFAEPLEDNPAKIGDKNVINILDYGIDSTGKKVETEKINKAIIEASEKKDGGIVYFPRGGIYRTGSINMKSNVYLYIEGGALIQASDNPDDYTRTESRNSGMGRGGFISFDSIENTGILGRGCIDLNGYPELFFSKKRPGFHSLKFYKCKNVTLKDIIIKRSMTWTIHFVDCDYFHSKNIKVINRKTQYWEDIYDIDISRHVLIENGFALSMDDMWAIKGTVKGQRKPIYDIVVKGFVAYGFDSGLAIGYANREIGFESLKDVTFEDIHIVSSLVDWGFHVTFEKGIGEGWEVMNPQPTLENWQFKNISFEDGGTFLIATGNAEVKNFSIENMTVYDADGGYMGIFRGNFADSIIFKGITNKGKPIVNLKELSAIGAGIDVRCPAKFLPSVNDAYRFSFENGLVCYKKDQLTNALLYFNTAIQQKNDYSKAYFYRGIVLVLMAEEKKVKKDSTWTKLMSDARMDLQKAEALGYFKAKEFWEKYCINSNWYNDIESFKADALRRVLFTAEDQLPY